MKEREICRIKTEQDVSYPRPGKCMMTHTPQPLPMPAPFATVVRHPGVMSKQEEELRDKVTNLETKMNEMLTLMKDLLTNRTISGVKENSDLPTPENEHGSVTNPTGERHETSDEMIMVSVTDSDQHCDHASEAMDNEGLENRPQSAPLPDNAGSDPTPRQMPGKLGKWKTVGKTKVADKYQHKALSDDDITPSPVLNRPSRSVERTKRTHRRKSWTDR